VNDFSGWHPFKTSRTHTPRPSWWKQEEVLKRLQSGVPLVVLCQRAHDELGEDGTSVSQLKNEVWKWSNSASMGEQFKAAMKLVKKAPGRDEWLYADDWHERFFEALERSGGKIPQACEETGIGVNVIYDLTEEDRKSYNAEFAERVRSLESIRYSKIRENVLEQAEVSDADGAKIGLKVLEAQMPTRHAAKKQLQVTGGLTSKIEHHFIPAEVVAASQARTKALLANRERPALASGTSSDNVIDLIPETVKEAG
jgi:hypothetical protein